jgi:hypothetical protein
VHKYLKNDVEDFDQMVMWADVDIPKAKPQQPLQKPEEKSVGQVDKAAKSG